MGKKIEYVGKKFGRLTVLSLAKPHLEPNGAKQVVYNCICDCGKHIKTQARYLRRGSTTSCGCFQKEESSKMSKKRTGILNPNFGVRGIKNPLYRYDISEEERQKVYRQRKSAESIEWKKAILKRDNYTCQCCKKRGGSLVAHHMNGFAKFPEQRFNLDNGLTLCKMCHEALHKNLGGKKKSCTRSECEVVLKRMKK